MAMEIEAAADHEADSWSIQVDAPINRTYARNDKILDDLYEKSKTHQWNVADYDWSYELNPENPLGMPDGTLMIYQTPLWQRMGEADRIEARRHFQSWTLSQTLHGEQAALVCAAKLAQASDNLSVRLCSTAQAYDEARHVEAYSRLINDKLGLQYPMSSALRALLKDTVSSTNLDITNLGMQILVEGIALSIFQNIVAYSTDPFVKKLITQIQRDEARHFAVGCITLRRTYSDISGMELREREEFICEGIHVLYEHLCADDIWDPLGYCKDECAGMVRGSMFSNGLRRSLFRRLVPTIRDINLMTPKVTALLDSLKMLDYADLPLR